jgi:hypothetical protein
MSYTSLMPWLQVGVFAAIWSLGSLAQAQVVSMEVDARSNLFGAGRSEAPDPGGSGGGILPPVYSFSPASNLVLTFSRLSGTVAYNNDADDENRGQWNGPDGGRVIYPPSETEGFNTDVDSYGGISGLRLVEPKPEDRRVMFLAGLFLDDKEPSGAAPPRLDFSSDGIGTDFRKLYPQLNQTFFIGDGLTGTGSGFQQQFFVPEGATRLFLGFIDAADFLGPPTFYSNNDGSFEAAFVISPVSTVGEWRLLQEAHEIIDITNVLKGAPQLPVATYKSAGDNPIPDALWPDYVPPLPLIKNTTRNLQFNESQFIASPGEPIGSTRYLFTPDGYTWGAMSEAINALWPYVAADYLPPSNINTYFAGNFEVSPPPGVVKVTANYKAQNMLFWANEGGERKGARGAVPLDRYFVEDQWGNLYIMHASGKLDQADVPGAFADAILPPGWTKSVRQLKQDLILNPAQGADGSFHYLVIRDSADNTYHQIGWSPRGSLMAQIPGMPIWGGEDNDTLAGDAGGVRDDVMHGASGNDVLVPGLGNDEIWGDDGIDTVVLSGRKSQWEILDRSDDWSYVELAGPAGFKVIHDCEFLRFDDGQLPIAAFRGRATSRR